MSAQTLHELDREWAALIEQGDFADRVDDWIQRWPALAPIARFDGGAPGKARFTAPEADEIFAALLEERARGDYPAGRLVLQCMLPAISRMAWRCRGRYEDLDEATSDATAAMWSAIATYDVARDPSNIARRLWSRTLEAVAGAARASAAHRRIITVPAVEGELEDLHAKSHMQTTTGTGDNSPVSVDDISHLDLGATGEVLRLIAWGVDVQALSSDEALLLERLYAPDPDRPEYAELQTGRYQECIARQLGISHAALRARASRAVRRLARAVQAAL